MTEFLKILFWFFLGSIIAEIIYRITMLCLRKKLN